MKQKCFNLCKIKAETKDLEKFNKKISKKFSMDDIVKIEKNMSRLLEWGCESDLYHISSIHENNNPISSMELYNLTDMPNEGFWEKASKKFHLKVEYIYFNKEEKYIGYVRYLFGSVLEYRFSEEEHSEEYKTLLSMYNFEELIKLVPELNQNEKKQKTIQKVIKMKDLIGG